MKDVIKNWLKDGKSIDDLSDVLNEAMRELDEEAAEAKAKEAEAKAKAEKEKAAKEYKIAMAQNVCEAMYNYFAEFNPSMAELMIDQEVTGELLMPVLDMKIDLKIFDSPLLKFIF